jgi:hypothetical protein
MGPNTRVFDVNVTWYCGTSTLSLSLSFFLASSDDMNNLIRDAVVYFVLIVQHINCVGTAYARVVERVLTCCITLNENNVYYGILKEVYNNGIT